MNVEAVWKGNFQVEVASRQFRIPVDESLEFHGDDTGMMPTELFLSSLASCFCLALVFAGRKKRIEVRDMRVNVAGEKDLKNFRFSKLSVEICASLAAAELDEILPLAKRYCFVSNTMTAPCPIEYIVK
ncbi:MAG: OsmC family protein [Deltaproteobacteria bacterium]